MVKLGDTLLKGIALELFMYAYCIFEHILSFHNHRVLSPVSTHSTFDNLKVVSRSNVTTNAAIG